MHQSAASLNRARRRTPVVNFEETMETLPPASGKRPIAVIGAGFSGTIAALHLVRRLPADQPVLLCERAPEFARGMPYASGEPDHLLNVRATNMSALADEPQHFAEWLKNRLGDTHEGLCSTEAGLFATRGLYSRYLRGILEAALRGSVAQAPLRLLAADITDVVAGEAGGYVLHTAGGATQEVSGVVLAVGSLPPEVSPQPRICANPWGERALRPDDGGLGDLAAPAWHHRAADRDFPRWPAGHGACAYKALADTAFYPG
jgi:uncharacterized NAD(P)/FAD-binding protein YdhS